MALCVNKIAEQAEFLNMSFDETEHYMCVIRSAAVPRDDVLEAVMKWISHDADNRLQHMKELLHYVHIDKCSSKVIESHKTLLEKEPCAKSLLQNLPLTADAPKQLVLSRTLCVVGGEDSNTDREASNVCWKIDGEDGVKLCNISYEGYATGHSVCKIPGGFVITGDTVCMMFNASTQSWLRMPDMLRYRRDHASICLQNKLFVFGGYLDEDSELEDVNYDDMIDNCGKTNSVDLLPMSDEHWQKGPPLPWPQGFLTVADLGSSVYLLDETCNQLLHLNADYKVWSLCAPLPFNTTCNTATYGISMTSAHGHLYVCGGHPTGTCAWYRPATDTWCSGQLPLLRHSYGTLVFHNDKLVLMGGSFADGTDGIEEYSIEEDQWSVCNYQMPAKLNGHYGLVLNIPNQIE